MKQNPMPWSMSIGRVAGIDLRVHASFTLLLIWVAWIGARQGDSGREIAISLFFITLVFVCVLLHELGHALTALRFGVRTRDIVLLPIGGMARLERIPRQPIQELVIAAAGPAVNVVLALGLVLALSLTRGVDMSPEAFEGWSLQSLPERLVAVNIMLVVFNLLPAFPMDGGRILRALLGFFTSYQRATQLAAQTGRAMAIIFLVTAVLTQQPFLFLIALFVWVAATSEGQSLNLESALSNRDIRSIMITDFSTLAPESKLKDAIDLTLQTDQRDFPVVGPAGVVGVLEQKRLLEGLARLGSNASVSEVMNPQVKFLTPASDAADLLTDPSNLAAPLIAVTSKEGLVGIVSSENLREFIAIQQALDTWKTRTGTLLPVPSLKADLPD